MCCSVAESDAVSGALAGQFSGLTGVALITRLQQAGYAPVRTARVAEGNGPADTTTVRQVVDQWFCDAQVRPNLLSCQVEDAGAGVGKADDG